MLKFRRKKFKGYCPKCKIVQKLTLVGQSEDLKEVWLRCDKCLTSHAVSVDRVMKSGRILTPAESKKRKEALQEVVSYSPQETYWIGQKIYHREFDDVGEVIKKEVSAGNHKLIEVKFEHSGIKKLIEGLDVN
ncbi:MAG: hypothetical protein D6813_08570 [Calditrichaeota bacterium]|nr:MAG: hypothetical protein D6813_08570 [Calditrichota bacterium]